MNRCPSCGGILGRDCFNPIECAQITASLYNGQVYNEYADALKECKATIDWMVESMKLINHDEMVETFANKVDNTLALIQNLVPREKTAEEYQSDLDELPF